MASFPAKTGTGQAKNERKKIIILIHSIPTRNRNFQKISEKSQKLKNIIMAYFKSKTGRERMQM